MDFPIQRRSNVPNYIAFFVSNFCIIEPIKVLMQKVKLSVTRAAYEEWYSTQI